MKKYLLFAGNSYYPNGGMRDLKGEYDTIGECLEHYNKNSKGADYSKEWDWGHVFSTEENKYVFFVKSEDAYENDKRYWKITWYEEDPDEYFYDEDY